MARNAEESESAVASDITRFAEPGPVEVSVATGWCFTRKYPSAMWPAHCSWRGEMSFSLSRTACSGSRMPTLPWPQMPKRYGTFCLIRYSAISSPPFILGMSVCLYPGLVDHFLPARLLLRDEIRVGLRRRADRLGVLRGEAGEHRWRLGRLCRFFGEALDDGGRRLRRRVQAVPLAGLDPRIALLRHRADVGQ